MSGKIIRDEDYNFGQPTLEEGFTVLQVVKLVEYGDYTRKQAADRLGIQEDSIDAALRYFERNRDLIEKYLKEETEAVEEYRYEGTM